MIKITDFGLSEDVYARNYFRQGKGSAVKLPVKWMAPESLHDGVFSDKTDVVSVQLLRATSKTVQSKCCSSPCHTVVIWGHLLGDLQWW